MILNRFKTLLPLLFAFFFVITSGVQAQNRDQLPAEFREYTNPEEVVTFDRNTSFSRALDVINEFAQEYRSKMIIDNSEMEGNIGISVPAMHWMDALNLILRVNDRTLLEKEDFYEIVTVESQETEAQQQQQASAGGGGQEGEGPVATTKTHEVRINAIFFEGNRRALQEIGVDWSTISENVPDEVIDQDGQGGQGGGGQGGQGGQQGPQIPDSRFDGPFVQVNAKGAQNVSQDVFSSLINVGEIGNTGIRVQALFSAFEADNLGEILASPTVKVMDGEAGRIQVGQDFSIKQRDIAGNVIEDFFSVGTILEVTPQVIEQNDTTFVHLNINAERSTAQPDPVSTIINKQQAETQSLLLDGEATVIAGLYSTEQSEVRRGIPILKDLPPWFFGLRYLFGYTSNDSQMRELVIVLQASLEPRIPERLSKEELRGKYEVLQDERQQMREELRESERAKETEIRNEIEDLTSEDTDTSESQEPAQPEAQQPTEENSDEQSEKEKEVEDKKSPNITDPEIETKEIPLNLGGEEKEEVESNNTQPDTSADKTEETTVAEEEETDEVSEEAATEKGYYIIGGSFRQPDNAESFQSQLLREGYNAVIIRRDNSDLLFVAYEGFDSLDTAREALTEIRQNRNQEAWLYRAN